MTPRNRLRSSSDFARVLREGQAVAAPGLVLYHVPRDAQESRFGFSVTRRLGGAVVRNRVKRLLREACRPLVGRIEAPADVVVVAQAPLVGMELAELTRSIDEAAARAGLIGPDDTR